MMFEILFWTQKAQVKTGNSCGLLAIGQLKDESSAFEPFGWIPGNNMPAEKQYLGINFSVSSASRSLALSLASTLAHTLATTLAPTPACPFAALHTQDLTFATSGTHLLRHFDDGLARALAITVAHTVARLCHQHPLSTRAGLRLSPDPSQAHSTSTLA